MSKIKNGGLDLYGAEPLEQQRFGTAGVEGVKSRNYIQQNELYPQSNEQRPHNSQTIHTEQFIVVSLIKQSNCRHCGRQWRLWQQHAPTVFIDN